MIQRTEPLQDFLDCLKSAFDATERGPEVSTVAATLFDRLASVGSPGTGSPCRLAVCSYLPEALTSARAVSPHLARLASAFEAIAPRLAWKARATSGLNASDNWPDGHANAMIVGQGGIEERNDIAIGVSLLAPHVRYPDHNHEPEEIYLVLTPGRFQHGDTGWFEPGPGGTLHNVPNIKHAMASGGAPLLAFWCLLVAK